jgi:hypothetical protein
LRLLADPPERLCSREDLQRAAWGDIPHRRRSLDSRVFVLRRRLAPHGLAVPVVRGRGFVLDVGPSGHRAMIPTATPASVPTSRTDAGWYLVAQLFLVFAAVAWGPLGAREAGDVSDVLPALRPAIMETRTTAVREQVADGDRAGAVLLAVAIVAAVCVIRARRLSSTTPRARASVLSRRAPIRGPGGCRAPPPSPR